MGHARQPVAVTDLVGSEVLSLERGQLGRRPRDDLDLAAAAVAVPTADADEVDTQVVGEPQEGLLRGAGTPAAKRLKLDVVAVRLVLLRRHARG